MITFDEMPRAMRHCGDLAQLPPIHLLEREYEVLSDIVCASPAATPGIELLWRELQRAVILRTDVPPRGLVCLHSRVSYTDLLAPLEPFPLASGHRERRKSALNEGQGAVRPGRLERRPGQGFARTVDVVGPAEPIVHRSALSVATPVGAALIGLQVGDSFSWASGRGVRALRVDRVEADHRLADRAEKARLRARRRLLDELLSLN